MLSSGRFGYSVPRRVETWRCRAHVSLSKNAKGCLFFIFLFIVGVGIMLGGLIPDIMNSLAEFGRSEEEIDEGRSTARILEVTGLGIMFAAIYGAAAWQFANRKRDDAEDAAPKKWPPQQNKS